MAAHNLASLLDVAFHAALGAKPASEQGFDGRVKLAKKGTCWYAVLSLETGDGPIRLAASADERVVAKLLAYAASRDEVRAVTQKLAQDNLKEKVANKMPDQVSGRLSRARNLRFAIAGVPGTGAGPEAAAARLYTRLVQRDPKAWHAVRAIIAKAHEGNPRAIEAWGLLLDVHARQKSLGWGTGTVKQVNAAARLYARLQRNDVQAWKDFFLLADAAEKGNLKAQQAIGILAQIHDERTRHALASGAPVTLSPARKDELVTLADEARLAASPGDERMSLVSPYSDQASSPALRALQAKMVYAQTLPPPVKKSAATTSTMIQNAALYAQLAKNAPAPPKRQVRGLR